MDINEPCHVGSERRIVLGGSSARKDILLHPGRLLSLTAKPVTTGPLRSGALYVTLLS